MKIKDTQIEILDSYSRMVKPGGQMVYATCSILPSENGAEGILAIMVGGEQKVFDECFDVLKTMGNPMLVGPLGSGQVSKLANQIIVGLTIGAVAEAVTLCEKAGANPNKMIKALSGGWADSKILQTHGKRMINKDFTPKGRTSVHLKDMNNILECAKSYNTLTCLDIN